MEPHKNPEGQVYTEYENELIRAHDQTNTEMALEARKQVPKDVRLETRTERQTDGSLLKTIHYQGNILSARRLKLKISFEIENVELEHGRIKE